MSAPPSMSMVAASGTTSTRYPIYLRWSWSVAKAVVLPAQGPPVTQILVIGVLVFCLASWSLDYCTIGSSMLLLLLAMDLLSSSSLSTFCRSILGADALLASCNPPFISPCSEKALLYASFRFLVGSFWPGDLSPPYSEPACETDDRKCEFSWTMICLETLSRRFFSLDFSYWI